MSLIIASAPVSSLDKTSTSTNVPAFLISSIATVAFGKFGDWNDRRYLLTSTSFTMPRLANSCLAAVALSGLNLAGFVSGLNNHIIFSYVSQPSLQAYMSPQQNHRAGEFADIQPSA